MLPPPTKHAWLLSLFFLHQYLHTSSTSVISVAIIVIWSIALNVFSITILTVMLKSVKTRNGHPPCPHVQQTPLMLKHSLEPRTRTAQNSLLYSIALDHDKLQCVRLGKQSYQLPYNHFQVILTSIWIRSDNNIDFFVSFVKIMLWGCQFECQ